MSFLPQPVAAGEAVVLRIWPSGETSVVASLLTADHGFVKVIAKSARKPRSSLRPLVQPGRLIQAEFSLVADRELQYLRGGGLVFDPLNGDVALETHAYLLAALELADLCRHGAVGDRPPTSRSPAGRAEARPPEAELSGAAELFRLCDGFLRVLSSAPRGSEAACFYAFELSLLALLGTAPVLGECTVCGRALGSAGENSWFSAAHGGAICLRCGGAPDARALTAPAATRMVDLGPVPPAAWPTVVIEPEERREIGVLLHLFLGYHVPGYRLPAALELLRGGAGARSGNRRTGSRDPGGGPAR